MSAIGRIFLILNLVLAAVFLGFAANQLSQNTSATESLRLERDAHELTKKTLGEQVASLTTQVTQLRTDSSSLRDDRDKEKLLAERNGQDLAHEKEANAQLRGELTGIKESLNGYNSTIASLTEQKDRLVKEKEEAFAARDTSSSEKAAADEARRGVEAQLLAANNKIAAFETGTVTANKKISALETELATLYAVTNQPRIGTPQALVEGVVVSVDTSIQPTLLAINKGKAHGVVRGTVFDLFNGDQYKGRAQVQDVQENMCSATITLPVAGVTISQGDRASTQL